RVLAGLTQARRKGGLSARHPPQPGKQTATSSRAAVDQAFADKLAKRSPLDPVERAQIEEARKRTKARVPRIAMHIEGRGTGAPVVYPDHSDEEGHRYRLADTFGTRSLRCSRA